MPSLGKKTYDTQFGGLPLATSKMADAAPPEVRPRWTAEDEKMLAEGNARRKKILSNPPKLLTRKELDKLPGYPIPQSQYEMVAKPEQMDDEAIRAAMPKVDRARDVASTLRAMGDPALLKQFAPQLRTIDNLGDPMTVLPAADDLLAWAANNQQAMTKVAGIKPGKSR